MKNIISRTFAIMALIAGAGLLSTGIHQKQAKAVSFQTCIFYHNGVQYDQKIVSYVDCDSLPVPTPSEHQAVTKHEFRYTGISVHAGYPPRLESGRPHCVVTVKRAGLENTDW